MTHDDDKLVDDENFLKMVESGYQSEGRPLDSVGKTRVWTRLQSQLALGDEGSSENEKRPIKRSAMAGILVLAAAAVLAVFVYSRMNSGVMDDERYQIKGTSRTGIGLKIGQSLQTDEGLISFDKSQRKVGQVVIPFVSVERSAAVLLVKQMDKKRYQAVSDAVMAQPHADTYFSELGGSVAVELERDPEVYCVVLTETLPQMAEVVGSLPVIPSPAPHMECFAL